MTRISRRRFLTLGAAAALALAAGAAWTQRRALRRWALDAPLDRSAPGPLSTRAGTVLGAVVVALLGEPIDPGHYVEAFRWRAENLPGHRSLVERFVARLDAAGRAAGAAGFAELPRAGQRRLLAELRPLRGWRRGWRGLVAHERARDSQHIVRTLLARFAATDAWVRLGYDAWPGVPRALTAPRGSGA